MRTPLLLVVLAFTPVLTGSVSNDYARSVDSPAARAAVRLLQAGRSRPAAELLAYPATYTEAEREEDVAAVASAFEALLREFGAISRARPTEEAAQYYEVGVGGGPRPGWWQEADSSQVTRQYVYDATFANAGPGYLVVLTSGSGPTEAPVFVGFALPASVPHAEATVEAALQALLDVAGVPAEHPFRSIQVPATSCPPASVE